jgi:hypothetical protein
MQIKGPHRQPATQVQAEQGQGVKAMQRKPDGLLGPVGMSRKSQDDTGERSTLRDSGEWSDDATARRLLDTLLLNQYGTCCGSELTAESIVISGCSGARIDDLIYLSAEMRGLIFRAYARRIADLLTAGGSLGEGHIGNRRLN